MNAKELIEAVVSEGKHPREVVSEDRALMRKIEDFILSADDKTLKHLEGIISTRRSQLGTSTR